MTALLAGTPLFNTSRFSSGCYEGRESIPLSRYSNSTTRETTSRRQSEHNAFYLTTIGVDAFLPFHQYRTCPTLLVEFMHVIQYQW